MKRIIGYLIVGCIALGIARTVVSQDAAAKKPKYTIKEVMKKAHVEKLRDKILDGSATHEQQHELLDLYISLLENEPPRGDAESWHNKAGQVVLAAAKVVVGREGAADELKAAVNCQACHAAHKPPAH
jgi:hypothetical protein